MNQKVLTRYLTRVGLSVDIAVHGQECIDLFLKHPKSHYDLILCDLFMPVKGKHFDVLLTLCVTLFRWVRDNKGNKRMGKTAFEKGRRAYSNYSIIS